MRSGEQCGVKKAAGGLMVKVYCSFVCAVLFVFGEWREKERKEYRH